MAQFTCRETEGPFSVAVALFNLLRNDYATNPTHMLQDKVEFNWGSERWSIVDVIIRPTLTMNQIEALLRKQSNTRQCDFYYLPTSSTNTMAGFVLEEVKIPAAIIPF